MQQRKSPVSVEGPFELEAEYRVTNGKPEIVLRLPEKKAQPTPPPEPPLPATSRRARIAVDPGALFACLLILALVALGMLLVIWLLMNPGGTP